MLDEIRLDKTRSKILEYLITWLFYMYPCTVYDYMYMYKYTPKSWDYYMTTCKWAKFRDLNIIIKIHGTFVECVY